MHEKIVLIWEIGVTLFVISFGTVLHFMYAWTNYSPVIGLFAPVNESVWEHFKLGFWSLILISLIEYPFIKQQINNFFLAKLVGVISLELVIVIFFYTQIAIRGESSLAIDIGSYVAGAVVCQLVAMQIMKKSQNRIAANTLGIAGLILIAVVFMVFTYRTPRVSIFKDENTGEYGTKWRVNKVIE
ncbi:MAG: hypothetical protein JSV25_01180 [Spirochaetota bacterium]|nr:MAG: hypothetical protein JSV25_01180 [Spirochaetota bacterium]